VPANVLDEESKLIHAGSGVRSERSAKYDSATPPASKVSEGKDILKGFDGLRITVSGSDISPATDNGPEMSSFVVGASPCMTRS
jgi:hypothetical protein